MVIIEIYSLKNWVHRGSHTGKDQIVILKDKQPGSPSLQAPLWRNDEIFEYQQESQLFSSKSEHTLHTHTEISKNTYMKWVLIFFFRNLPSHLYFIQNM